MTEGTDWESDRGTVRESSGLADEPEALAAVGAYEEGDNVVLYDTENPLAWVQASETVELTEMA